MEYRQRVGRTAPLQSPAMAPPQLPLLCLLASPQLHAGGTLHDLPNSLPGFLAARLAWQGDWASREALCALFWPERSDADALKNLRVNLHRLRQWLDERGCGELLHAEKRRVHLALPTDVAQFRAACGAGQWAEALARYRGSFMAGGSLPGLPAIDEWLHTQRQALAAAWREAALRQAHTLEAASQWPEAFALLHQQLDAELLAEDLVQALLRVAGPAGRADAALALHARFEEALGRELGLQPLPATTAAAAVLRAGGHASAVPAPVGLAPAPTRSLPARLAAPPLVGRSAELARLRTAAAPAQRGLVLVCGEAGAGKTRLVESALPEALWLPCQEALRAAPLHAAAAYVEDSLQALQPLQAFATHRRVLAHLVPAALPGEQVAADASTAQALLQALQAVLAETARPVVVDDLQWADADTLDLVHALAQNGPRPVLATLRSAEASPALAAWLQALQTQGLLTRLDLAPLDGAALSQLVAELSGQPGGAPRFAQWLHGHSAGNPFFALETLKALFAEGRLQADAQGWHSVLDQLSSRYAELSVPPQVAELVQRRVQGLGDSTRRVLRMAAVAGHARWLEPLAQVTGLSAMALAEAVGEAQQANVLKGREFVHDLVRQALADELPEAVRATTHALWLRHAGDRLAPHARATHAWAVGEPAAAVTATVQAAQHDALRGLHGAASRTLGEALARVEEPALRAQLLAEQSRVQQHAGDLLQADRTAAQALTELPAPEHRALALTVQGEVALQQGRVEAVAALAQAALEAYPACSEARMLQVKGAHAQGDYAAAEAALRQLLAPLRAQRPSAELATVLTSLGACMDYQGRSAEGLPQHQEALALSRKLGARYMEVQVANNLLWSLPEMGQHDEAMRLGEAALALGDYDTTPTLRNNLAWIYLEQNRLPDAARLYAVVAQAADPTVACVGQAKCLQVHALMGAAAEAEAAAQLLLARMAATDYAQAHAIALVALLDHGPAALKEQGLAYLPRTPVDAHLQQRLDAALARHRAATA